MEFRIKDVQLQANDNGELKIGGYINVTERPSEMLFNRRNGKWFTEVMKKGVFQRAIDNATGIPLLFEHNWQKQLASTIDGNLALREDNIGLRFDAVIKDEAVYEQVSAGLINSCSFGFRAITDEIEPVNAKLEKRFVTEIELLEVSLVKNPAYVGSLCESRALEEELQEERKATPEDNGEVAAEEAVEVQEEITEEVIENSVEVQEEVTDEEATRTIEGVIPVAQEDEQVKAQDEKAYLTKLIEELIEAKLGEINQAEVQEENTNFDLEITKEIHKEIEADLEEESMMNNAEVIKLRLELLKLKQIKEGI